MDHRRPMCKVWLPLALAFAAVLLLAPAVRAESPQRVTVGVYVTDTYDLNIKNGNYRLDFFLWFRWQGKFDPDRFELVNARDLTIKRTDKRDVGGWHYVQYRCQGEFHSDFDMDRYPLDQHELTIEIEDESREAKDLVFVPDLENSRVDQRAHLGGWIEAPQKVQVVNATHASSYGMPGRNSGDSLVFSRFILEIPIRHAGMGIYLKDFLPVFISVMIAFLSILIPVAELGPRLDSGLAGTFGVVASHMAGAQNLPETPYFTLADKLHVASLIFVFLTLLSTCVVFRQSHAGRPEAAKRLNLVVGVLLVVGYLTTLMVLTRMP